MLILEAVFIIKDKIIMLNLLLSIFLIISGLSLNSVIAQHAVMNDEFNSPCSINDWQNITQVEGWMTPDGAPAEHLEEHDISATYPGELYMMPWTTSWYSDIRGALIFKEITGDFVFTTRIIVRNRAGQAILPGNIFSLAGMMIREPRSITNGIDDWAPGGENYVFLSIGRGGNGNGGPFELEVKNTTNSNSVLDHPNIGVSEIYMRMVKVNGVIIVMRSFDNLTWSVHTRFNRPDFSETCQLGFVTYTDWPRVNSIWNNTEAGVRNLNTNILNDDYIDNFGWDPDIIGRFEFARYDDLDLPSQYENGDFMSISDTEIVSLFGYESTPTFPSGAKIWNGSIDSDWTDADNWNGGIPETGDHVVIPNCSCPEVEMPILPSSTPVLSGLHLEKGAALNVPLGRTLVVDLVGDNSVFVNEGDINNYGTILVNNASGKIVKTVEVLTNNPGSEFRVN